MCRGKNNHKYCVTIKVPGQELEYSHKTYSTAAKHTAKLNGKKQPRLSRWYNLPLARISGIRLNGKVMIKRSCKRG